MSPSDLTNLSNAYNKVVTVSPQSQEQCSHCADDNDESYESKVSHMAQSDISSVLKNATDILHQLKNNQQIEPWVAEKIVLANDYLNTVAEWVSYKETDKGDELSWAVQKPQEQQGQPVQVNGAISF